MAVRPGRSDPARQTCYRTISLNSIMAVWRARADPEHLASYRTILLIFIMAVWLGRGQSAGRGLPWPAVAKGSVARFVPCGDSQGHTALESRRPAPAARIILRFLHPPCTKQGKLLMSIWGQNPTLIYIPACPLGRPCRIKEPPMPHIIVQDLTKTFRVAERQAGAWGALRGLVQRRTASCARWTASPSPSSRASWSATSAPTARASPPPSRSWPASWCPTAASAASWAACPGRSASPTCARSASSLASAPSSGGTCP